MNFVINILRTILKYITDIIVGIWHLGQGMYVSMRNFARRKVTEQYPENRGTKQYFERTRGHLTLDSGKCIACSLCSMQCPNGSIEVTAHAEDGKKQLDAYRWKLGQCTFCSLCVGVCPVKALGWKYDFEDAVFNKASLVEELKIDN